MRKSFASIILTLTLFSGAAKATTMAIDQPVGRAQGMAFAEAVHNLGEKIAAKRGFHKLLKRSPEARADFETAKARRALTKAAMPEIRGEVAIRARQRGEIATFEEMKRWQDAGIISLPHMLH